MNNTIVSSFSVSTIYIIISILASFLIGNNRIHNSTRNIAIVVFLGLIPMICSLVTYLVLNKEKEKEERDNILNIMTIVFSLVVIIFVPLVYYLSNNHLDLQSTNDMAN